ncbi:MAG TPA: adenosine deaminase [Acidobacteriota bacterium]|nr:adenosine deaminase [Acidobacteriota bacterium]
MTESLIAYARKIPKAEVHLHLEGSVKPKLLAKLAAKYKTEIAGWPAERIRQELYRYKDFQSFLNAYRVVCSHLREPGDYVEALDHLAAYFQDQNIRYAEIIYSPSISRRFDQDAEQILSLLLKRGLELESETGTRIRWILDAVRQWGPGPAQETVELAAQYRGCGVVAVGLGGDETSLPAAVFQEVFSWARAHQLFVHIHAGETGGPEQVWDAIQILGANRIGHGLHAARDPNLMEHLRERAVALDLCLTGNLKTGAWSPLSAHPFQVLMQRGVQVTLNTDDPGMFDTTLCQEFEKAIENFGLDQEQVRTVSLQALHSCFLDYEQKMALMAEFHEQIQSIALQ